MERRGLLTVTAVLIVGALVGASCGNDELSDDPLPPMYTTTTSTTIITTTTEYIAPVYVVQPGDLLANIARSWGVDMDELMALNEITDPNHIEVGQELDIPPSTAPVAETLPGG